MKRTAKRAKAKKTKSPKTGVVYLSGGNPQIAMADGDAPVQAYIKAMPGWKSAVGKQLDALIVRTLPRLQKAVKWNSPLYGIEGRGYFMGMHVFNKYIKVTFFQGAHFDPLPPGPSKDRNARHLDIHENDKIDEKLFARWLKQAAKLPGYLAPKN